MFISFDFAYWSTGDTELITDIVGNYSAHPAQAYYNDGALVSTFVGDSMNWNAVKDALPGQKITAIPMIQDPAYIPNANTGLDGAFSWYAWATDGGNSVIPGPMTTIWDDRFLQNLGEKPYMARKWSVRKRRSVDQVLTLAKLFLRGSSPTSIPRTGSLLPRSSRLFAGNKCWLCSRS